MGFRWRPLTLDQQFADSEERQRLLQAGSTVSSIPDPWEGASFDPVWHATTTDPSIGDGSLQGHMVVAGRSLFVRLFMLAGSTTTFGTGDWYFTVPHGLSGLAFPSGHLILDGRVIVGGDHFLAQGHIEAGAPTRIYGWSQTAAATTLSLLTNAYPAAWGAGDSLELHGFIELA